MSLLSVAGLTIRYDDAIAVNGLSFAIEKGESVGLVGESGSGKSQTALAILGLLPAQADVSGDIRFEKTALLGASERALDSVRAQRLAIVFQDPAQALNPFVRIGQQLRRILLQHGLAEGAQAQARVIDMLRRVGLSDPERQYRAYPHQLSGGMRQRAMIASALITEPELLIADEPTTALDVTVQAQILELLEDIRKDTALLLITHDLGVVAGHCERMLVLKQGELVEQGATRDVFARPQHEHTARLLAAAPRLDRTDIPTTTTGAELLTIKGASVSYRETGHARLQAVRDVDLTIRAGETVALVGESGSGKSSLARAVLGLVPLQSGRVAFCGTALEGLAQDRATAVRRGMQLVFQDPVGSLNPQMRVANIVAEPLLVHEPDASADTRQQQVIAILEKTGLGEEFLERYPHELSGGEAQRVAIARALILKPKVLVCDEAVAALDGTVREQILALLHEVQIDSGLSIVFITHDLSVVRGISHRVLVMYMGALVELADNNALFEQPRHPYTRALLAAVPVPDPERAGGKATLAGEVPSALAPPSGCTFHPRCPHARDICKTEIPEQRTINSTTVACHRAEEI
ncbi:MAG: ABC transporter ATP-binding protein [Gammaproteobacteria bacterium]|jgi:oligopeptide/dipeptide ABC transporter ATP-binding protein|nr:ABC transporter ATP-binding protein [Gammaproteobacteria bacterium]MDH3749248.1 ABC transporter ATP-binding protein [Gammaproteobacteria bacterium]MDH3805294.1 ABC transporter ATP-binding protein [Gammaproteobacteria bacterium]